MYAPYGVKKIGGKKIPLSPGGCTAAEPPTPGKTVSLRFPRCRGCPYPRHGLVCWTDEENCLRADMDEIERRSRNNKSPDKEAVAY
jgi:hypothetical protein